MLDMGKTIKSYATVPLSISFPWEREGKPLTSSLKTYIPLSSLSISPATHLFQCTQCTCGTLLNCPLFCIEYMYFSILSVNLSFSSNRKAGNSAPSFQFITSGRGLTQKSMKSTKFQHFQLQKEMKFGPHQIYSIVSTGKLPT